ncbi:MAG: hypothetical protein IJP95_03615, partial [Bacteroidales bacterium]|nr:hypothetical protein [Bacteroidales bacterium]
ADAAKALTVNLGTANTPGYVDIANGADVYVILPPMTRKQLTMKIYNDDGYYTQKTAAAISLARNHIYTTTVDDITFADNLYFSVSSTNKVLFSPGNLQWSAYNGIGTGPATTHGTADLSAAGPGTFRFSEHQWDFVGGSRDIGSQMGGNVSYIAANGTAQSDNHNIDANYAGWIDMFGWGTSGWNSGATAYMPYNHENLYYYYYYIPNNDKYQDLTGICANADWGVFNAIYNTRTRRIDPAGTWRTLSDAEWGYLLKQRTTTSGIRYAKAIVNGVNGLILVPDQWKTTTYTLNATNNTNSAFSSNTISLSDWSILENAGCVFLPAGGDRMGTDVQHVNTAGYYWTTTHSSTYGMEQYYACDMYFTNNGNPGLKINDGLNNGDRYAGRMVRLVKNYE